MAINTKTFAAKNLLNTTFHKAIGFVSKFSIVPERNSSEKSRMQMAGIKMRKIIGERIKKESILAKPKSNKLKSPEKIHKNKAFTKRKRTMVNRPVREPKN